MLLRCTQEPRGTWVHIRRRALRQVMGADRVWISPNSRINGETVYLHKEQDFELFRKVAESKGIPVRITVSVLKRDSPIRRYERFHPDVV